MFIDRKNGKGGGLGTLKDPANEIGDVSQIGAIFLAEGDVHPPLTVSGPKALAIHPYKKVTDERCVVTSLVDLQAKPVIQGVMASGALVMFNVKVDGDLTINAQGQGESPAHFVLVNCEVTGDIDLSGSRNVFLTVRETVVAGDINLENVKDGRVHLQHTEVRDVVVDDETTVQLICGSTDEEFGSKNYGKPVDCCRYRAIKHKDAKAIPETFPRIERGTGAGLGKTKNAIK